MSRSNGFLFRLTKFCNGFSIVCMLTRWCRIAALTVSKHFPHHQHAPCNSQAGPPFFKDFGLAQPHQRIYRSRLPVFALVIRLRRHTTFAPKGMSCPSFSFFFDNPSSFPSFPLPSELFLSLSSVLECFTNANHAHLILFLLVRGSQSSSLRLRLLPACWRSCLSVSWSFLCFSSPRAVQCNTYIS